MIKQDKSLLVKKLSQELAEAKSVVFVNFTGMGVKAQQDLKKSLREAGARMVVVKNTLLKLAGTEAKLPKEALEDSVLAGQTAVVIADEDPVSPIAAIGNFLKKSDKPEFKIAVVEGTFQGKDAVIALSKLPGKDVLLGQAMGSIAAPLYGILGALNSKMQELLYILDTKSRG